MRQSFRAGTSIVKAIHFPSGDHSRFAGFSSSRVSWVTAPSASIQRVKICALGTAVGDPAVVWPAAAGGACVYAMRVPSGDHFGFDPSTRKRARDPSAFTIQSDDSHLSVSLSIQRRVNTTCRPSGESCGSCTSSQSR